MTSNQMVNVRPAKPPVQLEIVDLFHPAVSSNEPPPLPASTLKAFSEAKKNVEDHLDSGKVHIPKGADVKIIPLGTGSAIPTKYRNGSSTLMLYSCVHLITAIAVVSSTLIQIPNHGNILLDAGEGTWGQLTRQFGQEDTISSSRNVWDVLRDLKCIFISHAHGDHHMGLANILEKRKTVHGYLSSSCQHLVTHDLVSSSIHPRLSRFI